MQSPNDQKRLRLIELALLSIVIVGILIVKEVYAFNENDKNGTSNSASGNNLRAGVYLDNAHNSQDPRSDPARPLAMPTCQSIANSTSAPLHEIKPIVSENGPFQDESNLDLPHNKMPMDNGAKNPPDPVVQRLLEPFAPPMPTPIWVWDGMFRRDLSGNYAIPPDTDGQAGLAYYVQTVNRSFQIWTKSGVSVYA